MKLALGFCLAAVLSAADSRLSEAAMQGDTATVRALLKQKADVNGAQGDGSTALHWAAYRDDLELVKLLLAAGADVRAATREGAITPLFMACTNGTATVIEALLDAGADAKSVKGNGTTALMTAAASGSVDAVRLLLDRGAEVNAKESAHGQTALMFAAALNRTDAVKLLLDRGADANITTTVKKLERVRFDQDGNVVDAPAGGRGAAAAAAAPPLDPDAIRRELDSLAHALGLASAEVKLAKPRARAGDVAARAPRKVGPDVAGGMTALLYAAREGHLESAQALVMGGADVNLASGDRMTPLVMAIANGHYDLAKFLLDHAADANRPADSGLTPLYATIDVQWAPKAWFPQPNITQERVTYLELMRALLEHGANPNSAVGEKLWFRSFTNDYTWVDPAGATAFWRAAQSSDTAAMKLLAEHGADPKLPNKAGETPLMAAAGIGWAANWSVNAPVPLIEAVRLCVELGNDVKAADNRGYTALHGAAYLGDNEMVKYLVSKGADVKAKSRAGDSPADMANGPTRFGQPHPETLALLESMGSPNSHNCRSDQCVVQSGASIYQRPLTAAEQADKDVLDRFAARLGFGSAVYLVDLPGPVARGSR
ncbi:MAG TPA: ankyrin repeat domain-containing protein [Candidatus Acidoferrales bacterium]|nr:ankyrin repeat domain-containing protein [Candidatus Acidoferrales bacterium]